MKSIRDDIRDMIQSDPETAVWLALELLQDIKMHDALVSVRPINESRNGVLWHGWQVRSSFGAVFNADALLEAVLMALDEHYDWLDLSACSQCSQPVITLPDGMPLCRGCAAAEELEN